MGRLILKDFTYEVAWVTHVVSLSCWINWCGVQVCSLGWLYVRDTEDDTAWGKTVQREGRNQRLGPSYAYGHTPRLCTARLLTLSTSLRTSSHLTSSLQRLPPPSGALWLHRDFGPITLPIPRLSLTAFQMQPLHLLPNPAQIHHISWHARCLALSFSRSSLNLYSSNSPKEQSCFWEEPTHQLRNYFLHSLENSPQCLLKSPTAWGTHPRVTMRPTLILPGEVATSLKLSLSLHPATLTPWLALFSSPYMIILTHWGQE